MPLYPTGECRDKFEEWAKVAGLDLKRWGGYCDKETWMAWFGWRAAWDSREPQPSNNTSQEKDNG